MEELGFPVKIYEEGKVKFLAPLLPEGWEKSTSPSGIPVFYNPHSKVSRDMNVILLDTYFSERNISVCDSMAGCGVRGIRLAIETEKVGKLVLNDINKLAYMLIKRNVKSTGLESISEVYNYDANALLALHSNRKLRFDYVDVDPAGSPSPFIENALRACRSGGLVGITATDIAPLCGAKPKACLRKYDAIAVQLPLSKEIAARILVGFIARTAFRLGISIFPVLTFYRRHFIRTFVSIRFGKSIAMQSLKNVGLLIFCENCSSIHVVDRDEIECNCRICGSRLKLIGPLWIGWLSLNDFALKCLQKAYELGMDEASKILKLISEEIQDIPFYYTVDDLGRRLKRAVPSPSKIVEKLRSLGYRASLTHFDSKGFKTDAPIDIVKEVFLELSSM